MLTYSTLENLDIASYADDAAIYLVKEKRVSH